MRRFHVMPKTYRDSVTLMQLASKLTRLPGIDNASASMATQANLDLLREAGIDVSAVQAGPNDLLIMFDGEDAAVDGALAEVQKLLSDRGESEEQGERKGAADLPGHQRVPRSVVMALAEAPAALAIVSVPGDYAAAEALKCVNLGLNVMLFSDNVSLPDEVMLKRQADARGLIVMGPDCGTAIIDGIPLAFANKVRRGPIGLVAASGTGLQQVTVLVDRMGSGITQAIGTGGRDLKQEVGGLSMLAGLRMLAADPDTRVIVLISKPPAPQVAQRILDRGTAGRKAGGGQLPRRGGCQRERREPAWRPHARGCSTHRRGARRGAHARLAAAAVHERLAAEAWRRPSVTFAASTAAARSVTRRRCCCRQSSRTCTRTPLSGAPTISRTGGTARPTRWWIWAMTSSRAAGRTR